MSYAEDMHRDRQWRIRHLTNAVVALTAAGNELLMARGEHPQVADSQFVGQDQEMITALRDDITTMIGDIGAVRAMVNGK